MVRGYEADKSGRRAARAGSRREETQHQTVWQAMMAHLRTHHLPVCRQWFEELQPLGIDRGMFEVRAASTVHRDYLRRQCADAFNDAARSATGQLLSVQFLGPADQPALPMTSALPMMPVGVLQTPLRANAGGDGAADEAAHDAGAPGAGHPAYRASGTGEGHHQGVQSAAPGTANNTANNSAHAPHQQADGTSNSSSNAARDGVTPARPVEVEPLGTRSRADGELGAAQTQPARAPQRALPLEPTGPLEQVRRQEPVAPRASALTFHDQPARYDTIVVNPDFSFDNFMTGPNNRLAHAAAVAVASSPGRTYNPLFVYGGVGLGKTHLLQAICLKIMENNPRAVLFYTSCEGFITQYIESVQSGEMAQFRHRFRDVDVLIIDDIHFLTKRERSQEEFFHTFNTLYHANKQLILSSDAPPDEIPDLEERLVSRFKWGLVAKVDLPEYETRIQILKSKARLRGLVLQDDVAQFVAARIDSNIRELEGAIVSMQIKASVEKCPITLALAKATLGDIEPRVSEAAPKLQDIITVVTEFFQVRLSDLQGKHRQRSIAHPRHVCMYLARKCTRLSLEEVGGSFGGRDHTTVMHAIRTVEDKLKTDQEFVAVLRMLEEKARKVSVAKPIAV